MPKKKAKPGNPTAAELPTNPEFQEFAAFTRRLMAVPKSEIPPQGVKASADVCESEEEDGEAGYAAP